MNENKLNGDQSKKSNLPIQILLNTLKVLVLLFIMILASLYMGRRSFRRETVGDLQQLSTTKLLQFESSLMNQLVLVEQMTKSPTILDYFQSPSNKVLEKNARKEFLSYKNTFPSKTIFWINDIDKKFYHNMENTNVVDPDLEEYSWYNMTLYETDKYNFNINYNKDIEMTLIWINAPVRNSEGKAIGIVGTGIELNGYVATLFEGIDDNTEMYLYEDSGKIIGAKDDNLIKNESYIKDIYTSIDEDKFAPAQFTSLSLPADESVIVPIDIVNLNIILSRNYSTREKISHSSTTFLFLLIVVFFVTFILLAIGFINNLRLLEQAVKDLSSGNADLTQRISIKKGVTTKFLMPLTVGVNDFIEKLQEIVEKIKNSKTGLTTSGETMSLSTQDTTSSISQILANIDSIHNQINMQHKNVTDTTNSIDDVTKKVDTLENLTHVQMENSESASKSVEEMIKSIEEIDSSMENMATKFDNLRATSEIGAKVQNDVNDQIQRIMVQSEMLQEANQIISAIAEQTNLLAMNAAIEAAHAGEAGKGFSVVADEIRKLSETSTDQSNAIGEQLTAIKDSISQVVDASEKSSDAFKDVSNQIKETDEIVRKMKVTMEEQTSSSVSINQSLQEMNKSSREVSNSSHEISENGKFIYGEIQSIEEITAAMSQNMDEMSIGAQRINDTAVSLFNVSKEVQEAIDNISGEIDQFKV